MEAESGVIHGDGLKDGVQGRTAEQTGKFLYLVGGGEVQHVAGGGADAAE